MQLITTADNFNLLLSFSDSATVNLGNVICYKNDLMIHYCYPFYNLEASPKDMGMIMMTNSIIEAKEKGLKYFYIGSLQRPGDIYKLQFTGIEWFDGEKWTEDIESVKEILSKVV